MAKRKAKKSADVESLQKQLDAYEEVFGEVQHFTDLIAKQEIEIKEAQVAMLDAKAAYDAAREALNEANEARDGTKHALFMFLKPGPAEILPLFDRMEEADENKHGSRADEWRREPISALRLSLIATNLLTAADVIFVGQLQDRILAAPDEWWESIESLTLPIAMAIADRLNEFINERNT